MFERIILWFRKNYSKLKLWFFQKYPKKDTLADKKLAKLKALDPLLFKEYDVFKARVFLITVVYLNFSTYLDKLKFLNYSLKEHVSIDLNWGSVNYYHLSLEFFLTDEKRNYIDPVKTIITFKERTLTFLQLYNDLNKNQHSDDKYHLRILSKFEKELLELTDALLRYSHDR
jgi:hypothetical protein